nr:MAG TPA: hypothetical protein [Caudoviricetes sp.]
MDKKIFSPFVSAPFVIILFCLSPKQYNTKDIHY